MKRGRAGSETARGVPNHFQFYMNRSVNASPGHTQNKAGTMWNPSPWATQSSVGALRTISLHCYAKIWYNFHIGQPRPAHGILLRFAFLAGRFRLFYCHWDARRQEMCRTTYERMTG